MARGKKPGLAPGGFGQKPKKSVGAKVNQQRKKGGGGGLPWFVQPLTKRRFKRERAAAEQEEFGPLERQMQKELIASQAAEADIGNYFNDYNARLQNLTNQLSSAYAAANQQQQALGQQTGQQETARMQGVQAEAAADAAKRGVDVDPSVSQRAASAQAARANLGNVFGNLIATQGANQAAYFLDKQRIGALEGIGQRAREASRRAGIASDQRELERERAKFRRGYRGQTREAEREFHLAQGEASGKKGYNRAVIKQAQLGVKQAKVTAKGQQGVAKIQQQTKKIPSKSTQIHKSPGKQKKAKGGGKFK